MGFSANFVQRAVAPDAIDDAVIDAIVLSACSDGMTRPELEALARMASELPTLVDRDEQAVLDRIRESFARVERDGLAGRLHALVDPDLDDDARRRIFAAATAIQYVDNELTGEENAFLGELAGLLGLREESVRAIVADVEMSLVVQESVRRQRVFPRR